MWISNGFSGVVKTFRNWNFSKYNENLAYKLFQCSLYFQESGKSRSAFKKDNRKPIPNLSTSDM